MDERAAVSTDPFGLLKLGDPIGPENDFYLKQMIAKVDIIVVAWGNWGPTKILRARRKAREVQVLKLLDGRDIFCFGVNNDGAPKHPLYVKADQPLEPYRKKSD